MLARKITKRLCPFLQQVRLAAFRQGIWENADLLPTPQAQFNTTKMANHEVTKLPFPPPPPSHTHTHHTHHDQFDIIYCLPILID